MTINYFLDKKMNSLTEIILLITSTLIAGEFEEYEERKLPADLKAWFNNKTDLELAFEDCMSSYTLCTTFQRYNTQIEYKICAIDKNTSGKGTFNSLCEMIYENCKHEDGTWKYFHDGPCSMEFVVSN